MIAVTFDPAGEATANQLIMEEFRNIVMNEPGIKLFKDENGILPFYFMSYGDLSHHDVWNGIDEHGWAREVMAPVTDGFLVLLVVLE